MQDSIFRKESVDRLKSPEQLNDYIHVARPGVWLMLSAVILLLVGMIVWGIFGTVETVVRAGALVEDGTVVCYVNEDDAADMKPGMSVTIKEQEGVIKKVSAKPIPAGDGELIPYLTEAVGLKAGDSCYGVEIDISGLDDGIYMADITVESIRPISFVIQ